VTGGGSSSTGHKRNAEFFIEFLSLKEMRECQNHRKKQYSVLISNYPLRLSLQILQWIKKDSESLW